jgi:hypothetical protein
MNKINVISAPAHITMDHNATATTPLTATSQFIEAGTNKYFESMPNINSISIDNDDEFDEDNIPGFSHPSLAAQSPSQDKGKGRAPPEQLAPPSAPGARSQSPNLSGNIGSSDARRGPAGPGARRTIGGVQVETRYDNVFIA